MKRKACVAGQFYPAEADDLRAMIEEMTVPGIQTRKALAVVSPHAGYIYSGRVAAAVFSSVEIPQTAILLGPAHREIRPLFAVQRKGSWLTPLGEAAIRTSLVDSLLENCALLKDDPKAHQREHSLEVQLPFLQYRRGNVGIVPICVSAEADYDDLEKLGKAIALTIRGEDVLIVSSTDMSHYISQDEAEKRDALAFEQILKLDPEGLFKTVLREHISMCGYQPTTTALIAAKELGASQAEIIAYGTSGDVTGDKQQVVGYAGIRIL